MQLGVHRVPITAAQVLLLIASFRLAAHGLAAPAVRHEHSMQDLQIRMLLVFLQQLTFSRDVPLTQASLAVHHAPCLGLLSVQQPCIICTPARGPF